LLIVKKITIVTPYISGSMIPYSKIFALLPEHNFHLGKSIQAAYGTTYENARVYKSRFMQRNSFKDKLLEELLRYDSPEAIGLYMETVTSYRYNQHASTTISER
jgi:hypothetical protein